MASEPTDNHGLHQYQEGETGWTHSQDMAVIEQRLPLRDVESERNTYEPHDNALFIATDTGRVFEGAGGSWAAADRKFGQLDATSIFIGGDAAATEPWVDANYNNYTFSESYTDLTDVPSTFTPEAHGDDVHTADYAFSSELFSGSYTDLTDVPTEFTPETHGNGAHTITYAAESDLFSGSYTDLTDVPSTFTPESHANEAHSTNFASESDFTSHTGDTSNPHSVDLDQALSAGNTLTDQLNSEVSGNDFWKLSDGSGGTNTSAYTMRFDDRDWRLWSGTAGEVLMLHHDTGDVNATSGNLFEGGSRVATRTWTDSNYNNYTFSEDYTDLSNRSHGNEDHDVAYADTAGDTFNGTVTVDDTVGLELPQASGSDGGLRLGGRADNHVSVYSNRVTVYSDEDSGWGWRTGSDNQSGYNWSMQLDHGGPLQVAGDTMASQPWVDSNYNNYTFSEDYTDLSNRSHGNEDHTSTFATESWVKDQDLGNQAVINLESPVTQSDLNNAQSTLSSLGGGVIVVPNGTHNDEWYIDTDNITLRGVSKNATLRLPDGMNEPSQCLTITGDNVRVENLTIDGNSEGQDLSGYSKSDCQHADGIGIYSDGCTIDDCNIVNAQSHSVIVWRWNNDLGAANTTLPAEEERFDNKIINCTAKNNGVSQNPRASLDTVESRATHFIGNTVVCSAHSITAITTHTGNDIVIRDNHLDVSRIGIQLHTGATNIVVDGNTLSHNSEGTNSSLLQLYNDTNDIRVTNNSFEASGNPNSVISLENTASNIKFRGNTVSGGQYHMIQAQDSTENVLIANNTFKPDASLTVRSTATGIVINDNQWLGTWSSNYPLTVDDATGVQIQNNRFNQNNDGLPGSIVLDDGFDCKVSGNVLVDGDGIFTGSGSSGNEIHDNMEITS